MLILKRIKEKIILYKKIKLTEKLLGYKLLKFQKKWLKEQFKH